MTFQASPHPAGAAQIRPDMLFTEAAETYLASRTFEGPEGQRRSLSGAHYIRPNTVRNYRQHLKSLALFFGGRRLCDIRLDQLRTYQQIRLDGSGPFVRPRRPHEAPAPCPTKPQHVNQELCILRAIMRRAGAWDASLTGYYEELNELESELPRALTHEEERRWLEVSSSQLRWHVVHWYSFLALGTGMSTNELRMLRLRDINLPAEVLTVSPEGSKNRYRQRTIPLRDESTKWAIENLIKRARALGSKEANHYIFPYCHGHIYDVNRPMSDSGLKKVWQEVRQATGLLSFRMYDTRHTAITRMAENGTPLSVIMSLVGHISPKMTQHYTHVSEQGKIIALRRTGQSRRQGAGDDQVTLHRQAPSVMYENKSSLDGTIAGKSLGYTQSPGPADELRKFWDLKEAGILTEDEFLQQKARVLSMLSENGRVGSPPSSQQCS